MESFLTTYIKFHSWSNQYYNYVLLWTVCCLFLCLFTLMFLCRKVMAVRYTEHPFHSYHKYSRQIWNDIAILGFYLELNRTYSQTNTYNWEWKWGMCQRDNNPTIEQTTAEGHQQVLFHAKKCNNGLFIRCCTCYFWRNTL